MKGTIIYFVAILCIAGFVRADQTIQSVQQALKNQRLYYGKVTGEKNSETIAAIRRYQIRNGLKVTGDLNPETLGALKNANSTVSSQTSSKSAGAQPNSVRAEASSRLAQNPSPTPGPELDRRLDTNTANPNLSAALYQPRWHHMNRRIVMAEVQRQLTSRGYYQGPTDGRYGPQTALALRDFQLQSGIAPTARVDARTLDALGISDQNFASSASTPHQNESWVPITKFKHGKWKVKWKKFYGDEGNEYGAEQQSEYGNAWWNAHQDYDE